MVRANEMVDAALTYEDEDDTSPAEAMLSVLIDLYTGEEEPEQVATETLNRAWARFTPDLTVQDLALESQALRQGIEVLAANLQEAGYPALAGQIRGLLTVRLEGPARIAAIGSARLQVLDRPESAAEAPAYPVWPAPIGKGA